MPLFSGQRKLLRAFNSLLIAGKIGVGIATGFGLFKIIESLYEQLKNKINQAGLPPKWKEFFETAEEKYVIPADTSINTGEPILISNVPIDYSPTRMVDINENDQQRLKTMALKKRRDLINYVLSTNPEQKDAYITFLVDDLIKRKGINNIFKNQIFINNLRRIEKDLQEGTPKRKPDKSTPKINKKSIRHTSITRNKK